MTDQMRFDTGDGSDGLHVTADAEFPSTRYQGSKRKISDWIWEHISKIGFESVLDAFGGTGAISHKAKEFNKRVIYNDHLRFNYQIGLALIENSDVRLTEEDLDFLLQSHDHLDYPDFIQREFEGLYFTDEENAWLDRMYVNIGELNNKYKQAIAYSALGQSCLAKRPYNLFHRANLYMRTEEVERSFGNKTTWEKSFEEHFRKNVEEFNGAVFDNSRDNQAFNENILDWEPPETDLVYLDPPYYDRTKQNGATDYQFYYHFLEGYLQYDDWPDMIDHSVKTKRLNHEPSPWTDPDRIYDAFEKLFELFSDRAIGLSYNTAGLPKPEELNEMLEQHKDNVIAEAREHQYALSTHKDSADEILFVAYD
jgi:adenine-specific DNA-methyltransferase